MKHWALTIYVAFFTLPAAAQDFNMQSSRRKIMDIAKPLGCDLPVHEIPNAIDTYATAAKLGDRDEMYWIEVAEKFLKQAREQGDACEQYAYSQRAFNALFITLRSHSGSSQYEQSREVEREIYSYAIFNMTLELYKRGFIQWLTPKRRAELGGGWLSQRHGRFNILGGYDCAHSTIFIDPTLRPFDLGAVMIHELDHFFRDKLINYQETKMPLIPYLVLDEALASMHAGFTQRSVEYEPLWTRRGNLPGRKPISGVGLKREFFVSGDRSMFATNGYLEKFWQELEQLGWNTFGPFHFDFFLAKTFLRKEKEYSQLRESYREERLHYAKYHSEQEVSMSPSLESGELNSSQVEQGTSEILQLISKHYFKRPLTGLETTSLSPETLSLSLSPLSNWASANRLWVSQYGAPVIDARGSPTVGGRDWYGKEMSTNLQAVRESIQELVLRFKDVSPSCKAFQDAASSGELDEYLGVKVSRKAKPHGPNTPKPGSDGVKPGSDGVKPGVVIRPCLHMDSPP